jgi:hypothetical protein
MTRVDVAHGGVTGTETAPIFTCMGYLDLRL